MGSSAFILKAESISVCLFACVLTFGCCDVCHVLCISFFVLDFMPVDPQVTENPLQAHTIHSSETEFVQKAVDQYSAETGKIVELGKVAMAKMPAGKLMPD